MTAIRGPEQQLAERLTPRDVQIGHRIRRQRVLSGYSRFTMAAMLDISEELLESYELGRTWIGSARLFEIADVLGVCISDFYRDLSIEELQHLHGGPGAMVRAPGASPGGAASDDPLAHFRAVELACAVETIGAYCRVVDPDLRGKVIEALKAIVVDARLGAGDGGG